MAANLFTKYNCTNCQDDITGIRVHCAECENFDLCLQCFAAGAEIGAHKNDHAYQFMDTGNAILSVFRGKGAWTAREEIRLLDAIEQYGFGNWEDISKHIETKSAEDAKEEYVNKFVSGTIGRHTWIPAESQRPTLVDHTSEDTGPLGAAALARLPPLDITTEEAVQLGYMPNRDSFEREYDPTAEQLISTMTMNVDDTEYDYMLKLAHVDMYTRHLRERVRRKRLVRDYQLVANFFRNRNYAQNPGMTREQKEFRDRFRVFGQFYTSNEYDRLLASCEHEKELRIRFSELCRYRYNGLTKIDECRHFEQHAAMALHRSTGPYGHGKTDNIHLNTGNLRPPGFSLHSPHHSTKKLEHTSGSETSSSSIAPKSMLHIADPISSVALSHNKNYLDSCRGPSATMTSNAIMTTMTTKSNSNQQHLQQPLQQLLVTKNLPQLQLNDVSIASQQAVEKQQQQQQQTKQQNQKPLLQLQENNNNNNNNSIEEKSQTFGMKNPFSLSPHSAPMSSIRRAQLDELKHLSQPLGSNILTNTEIQLCKAFNLAPTNYLSLKTVLLSGASAATNLTPVENSLRKYFIKVGWLSH